MPRRPTTTNASPASKMKIVVILLAIAGLALIFAARRMEMPAVRTNARLVGGAAMLVALGLAVVDALKN